MLPYPRPLFISRPPSHYHIIFRNAIIFRYAIYEGKHIPPQRHGNGGRGQQQAPLQGASDKTSGKHISMHSSASHGIPPELPAAHGPLPGVDETARLPLPVPMLSPWAASKRPVGALSPTDVALFPTSSCTDEGSLREASQMPGTLSPEGCPDNQPCGPSARTAALY